MMEFIMEHIQKQSTLYMRRTGAYGTENVALMASLKEWAIQKGLFEGSTIYGIAHDGPETPPEQCRYDVCLVTELDCPGDGTVRSGYIPGGTYAVFTIPHTAQAVQAFWQNLFAELQENNLPFDSARPVLERYRQDVVKDERCEFCVPVASLS